MMEKGLIDKLKDILLVFAEIDSKLGFKKFKQYLSLVIILLVILNYKPIIKDAVTFFISIEQEIHAERMEAREELNSELKPILVNFRAGLNAERILYFEYHNSKENVLGLPFKYFELVLQDAEYGIPEATQMYSPREEDNSIPTGYITGLYSKMQNGEAVVCRGDENFKRSYPGVYELFHQNDSAQAFAFISVPGIKKPVGFLVIEWMDAKNVPDSGKIEDAVKNFIPRMNALIVSKSKN